MIILDLAASIYTVICCRLHRIFCGLLGPVILFVISLVKGTGELFSTYRLCFLILGIPAIITIVLIVVSKIKYPNPEIFEKEKEEATEFKLEKSFLIYIAAICCYAFGFADFTMITLHAAKTAAFPAASLSLLYALAMAVDAFAALFFGWLFDKTGLKAMVLATACSTLFSCFIFLTDNPVSILFGIVLWGIGMGAEDSIMKAAVSNIVPKNMRSTGFGIFETCYGIAWFLGSWLLGALYDFNTVCLVAVSVAAQLCSIAFYILCIRVRKAK